MTEFPIPGSDPVGIVVGPDGTVWVAEDEGNQIARLLPPAM
jgi:streptogramin lyase